MEEIKLELRQDNINVKCNAVAKLTYVSLNRGHYFFFVYSLNDDDFMIMYIEMSPNLSTFNLNTPLIRLFDISVDYSYCIGFLDTNAWLRYIMGWI